MENGNRKGKVLFQIFVLLFCCLSILFFIHSISGYYDVIRTQCILAPCSRLAPFPPTTIEALAKYNFTLESYAFAFVLIECTFASLFYIAAFIIFIKSKREMMGLLAMLALVTYGTTYTSLVYMGTEGHGMLEQIPEVIGAVGRMAMFLFFLLFPNGRLVQRWTIYIFIPFCIIQVISLLFPNTALDLLNWPSEARLVYYLVMIGITLYSQIIQFKKKSSTIQRQQTKWVIYGFAISFLGSILMSAFFVYPVFLTSPVSYLYVSGGLYLFVAIIPLTLSFAILRHRLWDIDPLVNRTIVYGTLSLSIILLYSFLVLYFSSLLKMDQNFIISLAATAIIAVLFAPLKNKLQLLVNRIMMGRHDDPYSVLKELGSHLTKPISPDTMLHVVIETIQKALRIPYVGISVGMNGKETVAAELGKSKFDLYSFPIIHGGEELGSLLLSSRSRNEVFSGEDYKLIDVLLSQAGPIVQNAKITLGMKLLAKDLQQSRERIVHAREEERMEIRRNLHDDLAPKLLSLAFNVAAAEQYIEKNPKKALELLGGLRQVIRTTVEEIRTMVHGLRPPTLDEFGLLGSIQARLSEIRKTSEQIATTVSTNSINTALDAPETLPELPAAVEVAVYRIVTESLVNVVRHSKATECTVRMMVTDNNELQIEVTDNGVGLPVKLKPAENGGIGLTSIRERAMELGGVCEFERIPNGGTRVKAVIPF